MESEVDFGQDPRQTQERESEAVLRGRSKTEMGAEARMIEIPKLLNDSHHLVKGRHFQILLEYQECAECQGRANCYLWVPLLQRYLCEKCHRRWPDMIVRAIEKEANSK